MTDDDLRRAEALLDVGRWQQALPLLAAVRARHPDSVEAACLMAQCHELAGDRQLMLVEAEHACGLDGDNAWAHQLRSAALRKLGRPREAVEAAQEAVRLNPHFWAPPVALVESLMACGDKGALKDARHAMQEALRLAPDHPDVRVTAARLHTALGDIRTARTLYQDVLASHPDNAVAHNNLALLEMERGHLTSAAQRFVATAAANPTEEMYARNAQLAASAWLFRLHAAATLLFICSWGLRGLPMSAAAQTAVATVITAASLAWIGFAYRRLPRAAARMVVWPQRAPTSTRSALPLLRFRGSVVTALLAVQILAAWAVIAGRSGPGWTLVYVLGAFASVRMGIMRVRMLASDERSARRS